MIDTERIIGRLAAWMTALVIVAISLNGYALNLFHGDVEKARAEVVSANRRLDRALDLLRDADDDSQELLEGQRTLAEQLEQAGIVPAIEVPPPPATATFEPPVRVAATGQGSDNPEQHVIHVDHFHELVEHHVDHAADHFHHPLPRPRPRLRDSTATGGTGKVTWLLRPDPDGSPTWSPASSSCSARRTSSRGSPTTATHRTRFSPGCSWPWSAPSWASAS